MTEENKKAFLEVVESERRRLQEIPTSRPLPCIRINDKPVNEMTIKKHFSKINEELDELKEAVLCYCQLNENCSDISGLIPFNSKIAEEAADTITTITTMLEALGIEAEMRDEAQRRVNEKNRNRGRL